MLRLTVLVPNVVLGLVATLFAAGVVASGPARAQDLDPIRVEKRVGKLEAEMRAVQRKVFPGGDARFFEPEITAPAAAPPPVAGTPASAPLADLAERVGELERQLRTLTGQVEQDQFKLRQLEEAQAKLRGDVEFRLNALEGNGPPPPPEAGLPSDKPGARPDPKAGAKDDPKVAPRAAPALRADAKAGKPATADADWKAAYATALAKDWPATETAMSAFLADWPKSTRIPQAQYWLGRSHAERKQHAEAARAFLDVYKTAPRSERAPDSLIGLANAMVGLKKAKDACRVLGELDTAYGEKLTAAQKAEAKASRTRAKCAA